MSVVRVTIDEVAGAIRITDSRLRTAVSRAARAAAMRLKTHIVQMVNASGINDLSTYVRSIHVVGSTVVADAPHAGIIERGCRPHKVSLLGIIAIAEWVQRKLRLTWKRSSRARWNSKSPAKEYGSRRYGWSEALSIAWAIAKTIEKRGQQGHYFMRRSLPMARVFYHQELSRLASAGASGGGA